MSAIITMNLTRVETILDTMNICSKSIPFSLQASTSYIDDGIEYDWLGPSDYTSTYSVFPTDSGIGSKSNNVLYIQVFTVLFPNDPGTVISSSTASLSPTSSLLANTTSNVSATSAQFPGNNNGGERIEIGVGVSLGLLFLGFAIVIVILLLRRHRSKRARPEQQNDGPAEKPELPGEGMLKHKIAKEVFGTQLYEMADTSAPVELEEGAHGANEKNQRERTEHLVAKESPGTTEEQENRRANEPKDTKADEIKAI